MFYRTLLLDWRIGVETVTKKPGALTGLLWTLCFVIICSAIIAPFTLSPWMGARNKARALIDTQIRQAQKDLEGFRASVGDFLCSTNGDEKVFLVIRAASEDEAIFGTKPFVVTDGKLSARWQFGTDFRRVRAGEDEYLLRSGHFVLTFAFEPAERESIR